MAAQHPLIASTSSHHHGAIQTDDLWDARINRPLASVLVRRLVDTRITPNQLTLTAGVCGLAAAFAVGTGHPVALAWAGVLMLAYGIFDCADGQLARIRGGGSFAGRMWDGFCDHVVALSIHFGLWAYVLQQDTAIFGRELTVLGGFLVALAAGGSLAVHAMQYDQLKNRLKAAAGQRSETDHPDEITARIEAADSALARFGLRLYRGYCWCQLHLAKDEIPPTRDEAPALQAHMTALSVVGPGMHLSMFAVSALLSLFTPFGMMLYVVFSAGFANVYLLAIRRQHKHA